MFIVPLLAATFLTTGSSADRVNLEAPSRQIPFTGFLSVEVDIPAMRSKATFVAEMKLTGRDESAVVGQLSWKDLMLGGYKVAEDAQFAASLGPRGNLLSLSSDYGSDLRVMAAPLMFVYPTEAVGPNDKYEFLCSAEGRPITYSYEVIAFEVVEGERALKLKALVTEEAEWGMRASGHYWVSVSGALLKLELDVDRWPVVHTGTAMDVKVTGRTAKRP